MLTPHLLLDRLVAIRPQPRRNLTHNHGVFAPAARGRADIVPRPKVEPGPRLTLLPAKAKARRRHHPSWIPGQNFCSACSEPTRWSAGTATGACACTRPSRPAGRPAGCWGAWAGPPPRRGCGAHEVRPWPPDVARGPRRAPGRGVTWGRADDGSWRSPTHQRRVSTGPASTPHRPHDSYYPPAHAQGSRRCSGTMAEVLIFPAPIP